MKKIFECVDGGQDGSDKCLIGYCSDDVLARKVSLGRGTFGNGNGDVNRVDVWESIEDVPLEIQERMRNEALKAQESLDKEADKFFELLAQASPESRKKLIARFNSSSRK